MKSTRLFLTLIALIVLIHAAAASAATIDMDDPRRALGREGDVRVDAQLVRETVSPGTPIGVVWQIQNFSDAPVAVATGEADATYDDDSQTITVAIGAEIPPDGDMPEMTIIAPGEKKVFRSAATPTLGAGAMRAGIRNSGPRYVQLKVAILRNIEPFVPLIEKAPAPVRLTDAQFDRWFASTATIFLNTLPVQFSPARPITGSAQQTGGTF